MTIDISAVPRRAQFVISGTGPYSCEFEILDEEDVAAYRDDALLTYPTDYSVSIADNGKFSITLVSGTGSTLTVKGARPYERLTDFQTGGDFKALTVDRELDSVHILIQQLLEEQARTLKYAATAEVLPTEIDPDDYAGKYQAYDAEGLPIPSSGPLAGPPVTPYMETMLDDVSASDALSTLGVSTFEKTVLASASAYAHRATIGYYDVESSMTPAEIQTVHDAAVAARRQLVFRGGTYAYGSSQLVLTDKSDVIADGDVLIQRTVNGATPVFYASGKARIRLRGLQFVHTGVDSVDDDAAAVFLLNCTDAELEDLRVYGKFYVSVVMAGCDGWAATRIYSRGVQNRGSVYPYLACKNGSINQPEVDGREYGGSARTTAYGVNFNPGGLGGVIENVSLHGGSIRFCTHQGISFGDLTGTSGAFGTNISDIGPTTSGAHASYGVLVQKASGSSATDVRLVGIGVARVDGIGILISESFYIAMSSCVVNGAVTGPGIRLDAAQYCSLDGNISRNNAGGAGIHVTGASLRNVITGGAVVSNLQSIALGVSTQLNRLNDIIVHNNTTNPVDDDGTSNSLGTFITS